MTIDIVRIQIPGKRSYKISNQNLGVQYRDLLQNEKWNPRENNYNKIIKIINAVRSLRINHEFNKIIQQYFVK